MNTHGELQKHVSPKSYVHFRLWTLSRRLSSPPPFDAHCVINERRFWRLGMKENSGKHGRNYSVHFTKRNNKPDSPRYDIIGKETGKGHKLSICWSLRWKMKNTGMINTSEITGVRGHLELILGYLPHEFYSIYLFAAQVAWKCALTRWEMQQTTVWAVSWKKHKPQTN